MKKVLFLFFIALYSCSGGEKRCPECGQPTDKCEYNGEHPSTQPQQATGMHEGYEWVDLGLPSGTKWATTNVGASSPSDYGNYYAWGETCPKNCYDWESLMYCTDATPGHYKLSKYVMDSKYGIVDGKKELDTCDDVAYVNWGSGWRMPSLDQMEELKEKCNWTWTTMGGHDGYKVVGPNGSSLFLPAAGYRTGRSSEEDVGWCGYYWLRTLFGDIQYLAYSLKISSFDSSTLYNGRVQGLTVRPVLAP